MKSHRDLDAYKDSMKLVTEVYHITKEFPQDEIFGLTNQIRRAAVSIPSNIAEGAARQTNKEFIHFLYIALGSLSELETQLEIAVNVGYLSIETNDELQIVVSRIRGLLPGLIKFVRRKS